MKKISTYIHKFFSNKKIKIDPILSLNRGLKNSYSGERCFILATGPSINKENLEILKGENCITVSNFFVHSKFNSLNPIFHVFAPLHPPITIEQFESWLSDADAKMSNNVKVVLSLSDKLHAEKIFKNKTRHFYLPGGDFPVELEKGIPPFQTVAHLAIYLAMYCGFEKIYLLGVDHDWLFNFGKGNHFYKENESKLFEAGHSEWNGVDLEMEFESHLKLWQIYKKIKSTGIDIVNLNPQSFLDVFPKSSLKDI